VASQLAPKFVKEILDWLLQQPDPNKSCNHIFLAALCVGEVRNRGELGNTEALVRQATKDLIGIDFEDFSFIPLKPVGLVVEVWKGDPDTLPWIKEHIHSHQNEFVRMSMLALLLEGWDEEEDPDYLSLVKERAQSDDHWTVRLVLFTVLADLSKVFCKDDPDILAILKKHAQSDEADEVRKDLVVVLARGWKDDPETLAILKERAQSDEADEVRQISVQELARGWKDDPEIQAFLKGL
jgi:hypothetical protein